ncbi:hypothetical protein EUBC25_12230 [Claveliimonas bilis]|uniref:hypothetical protein n=1 Tax=Claveliimonas bilis TaxID=3028070 RepID=UPI002B322ACE|nr:hypothetical protein EUBC25_12230 [Claveliimonas bilis]
MPSQKIFSTFDEQIELLKSEKHLVITDETYAKDVLMRIGYTSKVLKKVTIGFGAFIQSSYAAARLVSLGFISFGILTSINTSDVSIIASPIF